MNKIVESLLRDFRVEHRLPDDIEQDTAFEHFAANLTIGVLAVGVVNTEDCVVGSNAQPAVDAIGTIVNGTLISHPDEVDTFVDMNGYLDVDFVFVQAKTSPSFDASALGDLGDFVERVLEDGPISTDTASVHAFSTLKDAIFAKSKAFKRRNPAVHLYYVTTGVVPKSDSNFEAREAQIIRRLMKADTLSDVTVNLIGASQIQKRSMQMANSLSREILFPKRVTMPDVPGVTQAFLGVLPIQEFNKLIAGEADTILNSIFYDNVRDWEGFNLVNKGMHDTLLDATARQRFVLMNNGVTVIAKKIQPTGDKLFIEDYQFVNGCQTSNVLWACRNSLKSSTTAVPIKIVATEDEGVIRDIIRATNSQTEIKQSQLLAVTDFQKQLELFFRANESNPLFYERRSRQYVNQRVEPKRVVTPIGLVKAYASMFLEEPHKTARDFGSVLKKVGVEIFGAEHRLEPYFLSALAYYWVDVILKKLAPELRVARYQILLAARLLYEDAAPPQMNSKKMEKYANGLISRLSTYASATRALSPAIELVGALMINKSRDAPRTSAFTQQLKDAVSKAKVRASHAKKSGGSAKKNSMARAKSGG